mgnify:CR=1 FL=1
MKVMWMGNIILPAIAEKESLPPVYIVGWLVGLSRRLTQLPDVALTYVFDAPKALTGEVDGYRYYGLVNPTRPTQRCGEAYTRQLEDILRKEQPFPSGARKISTRWPWLMRRNTWGCASGL